MGFHVGTADEFVRRGSLSPLKHVLQPFPVPRPPGQSAAIESLYLLHIVKYPRNLFVKLAGVLLICSEPIFGVWGSF